MIRKTPCSGVVIDLDSDAECSPPQKMRRTNRSPSSSHRESSGSELASTSATSHNGEDSGYGPPLLSESEQPEPPLSPIHHRASRRVSAAERKDSLLNWAWSSSKFLAHVIKTTRPSGPENFMDEQDAVMGSRLFLSAWEAQQSKMSMKSWKSSTAFDRCNSHRVDRIARDAAPRTPPMEEGTWLWTGSMWLQTRP